MKFVQIFCREYLYLDILLVVIRHDCGSHLEIKPWTGVSSWVIMYLPFVLLQTTKYYEESGSDRGM